MSKEKKKEEVDIKIRSIAYETAVRQFVANVDSEEFNVEEPNTWLIWYPIEEYSLDKIHELIHESYDRILLAITSSLDIYKKDVLGED